MRSGQAIRTSIGCIACTVIKHDVIYVYTSTIANAEAVNRVVLDIDVMDRAISKNLAELNEVVGPISTLSIIEYMMVLPRIDLLGKASVATKTVPP